VYVGPARCFFFDEGWKPLPRVDKEGLAYKRNTKKISTLRCGDGPGHIAVSEVADIQETTGPQTLICEKNEEEKSEVRPRKGNPAPDKKSV